MIRLIDADKLETTAVLGVQLQHADSRYYYFYEEETIAKAPTVEAIPIEWLKRLQVRYLEADCNMSVCVVNEILNLWRKENETGER